LKVLIAGDWHSLIHEESCATALKELGHKVVCFPWHAYFEERLQQGRGPGVFAKAQKKYLIGPSVDRLNNDLLDLVASEEPDLLFIYRGTHVYPETLREIRSAVPTLRIAGFNNDDPFSPVYPRWQWRHFVKGIPQYDIVFAYRPGNLEDLRMAGARDTALLMPWFSSKVHRPISLSAKERASLGTDVVFIGHFEDDERVPYMRELVQSGLTLKVFGPPEGWSRAFAAVPELKHLPPVYPVVGDEYVKALCASKIAVVFLSKMNRDAYTRRCFEIPATGTAMLSTYTPELSLLFKENEEVVFFRNTMELIDGARLLAADDELRKTMAEAGRVRVNMDHHDNVNRMQKMLEIVFR